MKAPDEAGAFEVVGEKSRSVLGDDRAAEVVVQANPANVLLHLHVSGPEEIGPNGAQRREAAARAVAEVAQVEEEILTLDAPVGRKLPFRAGADRIAKQGVAPRSHERLAGQDELVGAES